jgi:putative two-component system response regulator
MKLASSPAMLTRSRTQIRPTEFLLEKTTILIVDDEPGPRESLKMILSAAHSVITCSTGEEALAALAENTIDVATLDLNMPGMKGDDLMRRIREEFPTVEVIIITGCGTVRTAVDGLRHGISDYISKPFDVVQVSTAVSDALTRRRGRARMVEFLQGVGSILGMDQESRSLIASLESNRELQRKLSAAITDGGFFDESAGSDESERTMEFLNVLAQALESRDSYLRAHAQRLAGYGQALADRLGLSSEDAEHVRIASFLHDFGKLGLDPHASEPAQDRSSADGLTEENHPELGAQLIKPLGFPEQVCLAIQHHHERWDGEGFPSGLSGSEIPLPARIIAAIDAYDLMTMPRDGKSPMVQSAAVEKLQKQAGHGFDPEVVHEFIALIESGEFEIEPSPRNVSAAGEAA